MTKWLLILAVAVLYGHLFGQLRPDWMGYPQYSYGWVVPVLAGYLFLKRWQNRPAPGRLPSPALPGIALGFVLTAFLITRVIQDSNRDWRVVSWMMAAEVTAVSALLLWRHGGWPWLRHFAFPIFFVLTAVPWPRLQEQAIVQALMQHVATLTVELLTIAGVPAMQSGNLIQVGTGIVGIDQACSGVRSLQSTLMASLFLGELYGLRVRWRVAFVAAGLVLAFSLNLVRTFLLAWIAARDGVEAVNRFHDQAGLMILFACVLALWAGAAWLQRGQARPAPPAGGGDVTGRPVPAPVSRGLAFALITSLLATELSVAAWYRSRRSHLVENAVWSVTWPRSRTGFESIQLSLAMRAEIGFDDGGAAVWFEPDGSRWTMYFFRWNPGPLLSRILARAHRPDFCMTGGGYRLVAEHRLTELQVGDLRLPFRTYTFEHEERTLHVFFCLWEDKVPAESQPALEGYTPATSRLKAVWEGRRDVLGQQTLEFVTYGYSDIAQAEESLRRFIGTIIAPGRTAAPTDASTQ